MTKALRTFQVFAKPVGSVCNLGCHYCYYLGKEHLYGKGEFFPMPEDVLEEYIVQHIEASPDPVIRFSWHGGEPTVLGLDYFQKIVAIQRKHQPPQKSIANGIQTNGTLLDEDWCRFFAQEGFAVGLSMDGPQDMHDTFRLTKDQRPTHHLVLRGYHLLRDQGITPDILCVVHAQNVEYPTRLYRFFKQIKAQYIGFLPLVEAQADADCGASRRSVTADAFGAFLCAIFDEWRDQDIGRIKIQIIEELARTALGQEQELCIFRETCGDVPVVEHNGDFFSCDHFVDPEHRLGNIRETPFVEMLEAPVQRAFGRNKREALPRYCQSCEVLDLCHGECPKNRFIRTPDGEEGLNYLCAGYRRFFNYCRGFVSELRTFSRRRAAAQPLSRAGAERPPGRRKIGRNDPCPCGSGRKYKKCCMGK